MKRTGSGRRSSSASATSTERRQRAQVKTSKRRRTFVVCVNNEGLEASLERNKIYRALPDAAAERDGDVRVIDESGEDYLFSARRFVAIEVPQAVRTSLSRAS